jgi:hypothetical protein
MALRSPADNENQTYAAACSHFNMLPPLSNPSTALRAGSYPIEGEGSDPLLPLTGRMTQEG